MALRSFDTLVNGRSLRATLIDAIVELYDYNTGVLLDDPARVADEAMVALGFTRGYTLEDGEVLAPGFEPPCTDDAVMADYVERLAREAVSDAAAVLYEYLGGRQHMTFAQMAEQVVQDYGVAIQLADVMLAERGGSYIFSDEVPHVQRLTIVNRERFIEQVEAARNADI